MIKTAYVGRARVVFLTTATLGFTIALVGLCVAPGCSPNNSDTSTQFLPTDVNIVCVMPSTSPQDVALPSTGGISGTLSFGPFESGATGCDQVKIASGDKVETFPTSASSKHLLVKAAASGPKPILTITVNVGIDGNPLFGTQAIVTGAVLNVGPDLNFPDGFYYMTVTRSSGRVDSILLMATNGVLRVAPLTVPSGNQTSKFPVFILASSTATLSLYARGVVPLASDPNDVSTPTVDVSDAGLPVLSPDSPPHPFPTPGTRGNPPPDYGAMVGYSDAAWTSGCSNNPGCNLIAPIAWSGAGDLVMNVPAGMSGVVSYETNLGYMGLASAVTDCPSDWDVSAGLNGNGLISIPASNPLVNNACSITYSTIPAGQDGDGYEITLRLRGIDIGAH